MSINNKLITIPEHIEATLVSHKGKNVAVHFAVSDEAFLIIYGKLSMIENKDDKIEYNVFTKSVDSCIIFSLNSIVSIDPFFCNNNELAYNVWIRRPKVLQHQ